MDVLLSNVLGITQTRETNIWSWLRMDRVKHIRITDYIGSLKIEYRRKVGGRDKGYCLCRASLPKHTFTTRTSHLIGHTNKNKNI